MPTDAALLAEVPFFQLLDERERADLAQQLDVLHFENDLLSQNRQAAKDRIRADVEYEVNLKAELEVAHLHEKVDHLHAEVLARLTGLERTLAKGAEA